ncbi:MAG TPA: phosphotransferase [Ktedonobacteraceae bacterium]
MIHQDALPDELRNSLETHYSLRLLKATPLSRGEEALIWQVNSSVGPLVVRMSPASRSPSRLPWRHHVLLALASSLPQALAPLLAADGSTLLSYQDYSVALFPYVRGDRLDRDQAQLRRASARLLAQLHTALLPHLKHPAPLERKWLKEEGPQQEKLRDPELDRWHERLLESVASLTIGLIHGDYYPGNLLTQGEQIVAVLDWDDLHTDLLMQEVAWACWEFGQTATSDDWHLDRVQAFLQAYREAGGPCKIEEYHTIIPFVRWRLREELRYHHFAKITAGLPSDPAYVAGQVRAFERLRAYDTSFI